MVLKNKTEDKQDKDEALLSQQYDRRLVNELIINKEITNRNATHYVVIIILL